MSDMKFILPGPETITLAGQTVDKLIRAGDGDAALLYLYILKTQGQGTSFDAATALGKSPGGIATAMAVLSRLGLVQLDENTETVSQDTPPEEPRIEPERYTLEEIKRELTAGSNFASIVEETQRSLGKILSPDELLRLFGIYDALRLPPEVILQLITHCISECRLSSGRAPSMKYIEKAAYTWEREGVFTLDRAEEYLKALEIRKSVRGEIKRVMQIKDREFSETEKKYVEGWIDMGFEHGAVAIAYDRTLVKTGKLHWHYMDSIIKSWHGKNLRTPEEIREKDGWSKKSGAFIDSKTSDKKFGAPNSEELERMQRLLKKIKED